MSRNVSSDLHSPADRPDGTAGRLLVIGCGMLAREMLAVRALNGFDLLDVTCLPADLHFHPDRIPEALDRAIVDARARGHRHIFAAFADCGTGGLIDPVCERHGIARIEGPHCFAFYQGLEAFRERSEEDMRAFYMTDFLCRHFETFFMRPLGLDRHPELAADYFGHYEKLVYLAQTEDPELDQVALRAAGILGLVYEKRVTGYGGLAGALADAYLDATRRE